MVGKLKYITTLLLMVIFPLSAVGLNISLHKCKHCNTLHFSLFDKSGNENNYQCCCDNNNEKLDLTKDTEQEEQSFGSAYGNGYYKNQCCTNSSISFLIIVSSETIDKNNKLSGSQKISGAITGSLDCKNYNFNKFSIRECRFPLKGPIPKIITFIHFASVTADETAIADRLTFS
jgi:hypothetical protein